MALGGGSFLTQNKVLPGAYINFISKSMAGAALSDRGVVTLPLELDWGPEGEVFTLSSEDFQKKSLQLLGYSYGHEKLKGLRDLFLNAKTLYAYRLNSGGTKASNTFAEAKYPGKRGNDLKIVIRKNADDPARYDVMTYLLDAREDLQTVSAASELTANDFVTWKSGATLAETAATPLTGGSNGAVNGASYQGYLQKIEAYHYNVMGVLSTDGTTLKLFNAFQKRLRDEVGVKFQLVSYRNPADNFGVISVENKVLDAGWDEASLVYWVAGLEAGCEVNRSCQNRKYDGEFTVETKETQSQLIEGILAGKFLIHLVNGVPRVLEDINTLVSVTETVGDIFKDNQTVRVADQIGNDIASLFASKYLGVIPNKASGRMSLWADIVKLCQELQDLGAIEDFEDKAVTVERGNTKKSVVVNTDITVVNAMGKLYMSVVIQ